MDKIGASTLLRINPAASEAEIEGAYRKRREEVRKHFEAARDRNTRTRCEREYFALEQARNLLLAETDDFVQEREELPANRGADSIEHQEPAGREAPLVEREEPLVERAAASVEYQEPPAGREAPLVEREELLVERAAASVGYQESPAGREAPLVEREEPLVERAAASVGYQEPPAGREASLIEREGPLIERAAASIEHQEPLTGREAPLVEREKSLVERAAASIELEAASVAREEPIDRGNLSERTSPPTERVSGPIERLSPPIERLSPPIRRVSPPREPERPPPQTASTQARTRSSQKRWLAITGVTFFVASAAAIILLLSHTPDRPRPGKLVLNTVPEKARVWLDGVFRGKTPLVLEDVAPGDRRLKIGLPEYETEELIVSVKPGDEGSTRIVQLVPMRQPSPKPTARQSPTSRPEPIIVPPTVAPSETPSAFPGERYPQTRERILTEADVASLDSAELRYAINEMYARYGAPFLNQPDIEKQFRAFPWYHPVHDLKLAQIEAYFFSAIEKRNLDILARLRDEKRPK